MVSFKFSVMLLLVNGVFKSQICTKQVLGFSKFWSVLLASHQPECCCRSKFCCWKRCWTVSRRGWTTLSRNHQLESRHVNCLLKLRWALNGSKTIYLAIKRIQFQDLQKEVSDFQLPDLEAEYTDEEGDRLDVNLDKYNDVRQGLAEVQVNNYFKQADCK